MEPPRYPWMGLGVGMHDFPKYLAWCEGIQDELRALIPRDALQQVRAHLQTLSRTEQDRWLVKGIEEGRKLLALAPKARARALAAYAEPPHAALVLLEAYKHCEKARRLFAFLNEVHISPASGYRQMIADASHYSRSFPKNDFDYDQIFQDEP